MDVPAISDDERKLLASINGQRKLQHPTTASLRQQAAGLLQRGLVAEDAEGLYVPKELLFALWGQGNPL